MWHAHRAGPVSAVRSWLSAKVLQVAKKTGQRAVTGNNVGRSKHHDGVADLLVLQLNEEGLMVFREECDACTWSFHEHCSGLLRCLLTMSHQPSHR